MSAEHDEGTPSGVHRYAGGVIQRRCMPPLNVGIQGGRDETAAQIELAGFSRLSDSDFQTFPSLVAVTPNQLSLPRPIPVRVVRGLFFVYFGLSGLG